MNRLQPVPSNSDGKQPKLLPIPTKVSSPRLLPVSNGRNHMGNGGNHFISPALLSPVSSPRLAPVPLSHGISHLPIMRTAPVSSPRLAPVPSPRLAPVPLSPRSVPLSPKQLSPKPLPVINRPNPTHSNPTHSNPVNIMSQPIYPIPPLSQVLARSPQPYLQRDVGKMIETGKEYEGRGIRTRGWRARAPKKGRDRHQLMHECGPQCFLKPETEGFPICPRCSLNVGGKCQCQVDCGGVQAALVRARQWGYPDVATEAETILKTKCKNIRDFYPKK